MSEERLENKSQVGTSKLVVLLLVLILLMTLVGTAAALYLAGVFDRGNDIAGEAEAQSVPPQPGPPLYHALDTITVNLSSGDDPRARARMLQLQVQLMTRHEAAIEGLEMHLPRIRNNLILLFSSQSYAELVTREAKERLRWDALDEINKVLAENDLDVEFEAVYFTNFVMQ